MGAAKRAYAFYISALVIILIYAFYFMSFYKLVWADDQYITLRYADNLANGYGLGYNQGIHDEGASSILYILICGIAFLITHASLFLIVKLVSVLPVLVILYVLYIMLKEQIPDDFYVAVCLLIILLDYNLVYHTIIGTENALFISTLFLTLYYYFKDYELNIFSLKAKTYWFFVFLHAISRLEGFILPVALLITEFAMSMAGQSPSTVRGRKPDMLGRLRQSVQGRRASIITLVAILASIFIFKLMYFGSIVSPPSIRKTESMLGLWSTLANAFELAKIYWPVYLGLILYLLVKRSYSTNLRQTLVLIIFGLMHFVIRITVSPDTGRYYNLVNIFLLYFAMIGFYYGLKDVVSKHRNALYFCGILLVIFLGFHLNSRLTSQKAFLESTPVDFSYVPAGIYMKEHSTSKALVSSSEIGAPAYFSGRKFLDLSGLTDYRYAKIWRQQSHFFSELYYYQLVSSPPESIYAYSGLSDYYKIFFAASPDLVFVIANPPSYLLLIHPEFQRQYKEVWKLTRRDNFRGYYAIYAKINSTNLVDVDV